MKLFKNYILYFQTTNIMNNRIFFFISAANLFLISLIHILSIFQYSLSIFYTIILFLGFLMFITYIPSFLILAKSEHYKKDEDKNFIKDLLLELHPKAYLIFKAIFLYAFFSFMISIWNDDGSPTIENNQYVLSDRGDIIKEIDKETFDKYIAEENRVLSGIFIPFLIISTIVLYKFKDDKSLEIF